MRLREPGPTPSTIVVVHGGPGAAGEIAPLAEELARRGHGVLEPYQTQKTVTGQIEELHQAVQRECSKPITLIGWSWGAWLGCFLAAKYPEVVGKLILVGSGPFEARDSETINGTRLSRLNEDERLEYKSLMEAFDDPENATRLMELFDKMDGYATDDAPHPPVEIDASIHVPVWNEAAEMRSSGELLDVVSEIRCPVLAIHGDHDPHPAEGVERPLRAHLPKFTFKLLERCGHKPWREIYAKEAFFTELEKAMLET